MKRQTITTAILSTIIFFTGLIAGWWGFRNHRPVSPNTVFTSTFTDHRDGKRYGFVKIGYREWMFENLNFDIYNSWCYDDDPNKCVEYGRLYTWNAAVEACAGLGDGWRLPTNKDWKALSNDVGGLWTDAVMLRAQNGWDKYLKTPWVSRAFDAYHFTAMPGGERYSDRKFISKNNTSGRRFESIGQVGLWWSATDNYVFKWWRDGEWWSDYLLHGRPIYKEGYADGWCMSYDLEEMKQVYLEKEHAVSVRCVR